MLMIHITIPEMIGILKLSSIGKRENSAKVVAIEPKKAIKGLIKNSAKINVPAKQAILPSKLFFVPNSFLLPKGSPIIAAKVSPIDKKQREIKAISEGKIAIQNIEDMRRYVAPVNSCASCLRNIMPKIS